MLSSTQSILFKQFEQSAFKGETFSQNFFDDGNMFYPANIGINKPQHGANVPVVQASPFQVVTNVPKLDAVDLSFILNNNSNSMKKSPEDESDKPKRPLSAYNIFFKHQREIILAHAPTRPQGKPRRSHGKIGFAELARTIAAKWRSIDMDTRTPYKMLAAQEKMRYQQEMSIWEENQKVAAEKRESSEEVEEAVPLLPSMAFSGFSASELEPIPLSSVGMTPLPSKSEMVEQRKNFPSQSSLECLLSCMERSAESSSNLRNENPTPLKTNQTPKLEQESHWIDDIFNSFDDIQTSQRGDVANFDDLSF